MNKIELDTLTISMSVKRVTLISNSANAHKILPGENDPAEFTATLPTIIPSSKKKFEVNMDCLSFRPVFANVMRLEKYGPHIVAWNCKNFLSSELCRNYNHRNPQTFPSEEAIKSSYWVKECTLDYSKRCATMEMLVSMLNSLMDWDINFQHPGNALNIARISYSATVNGLKIEGDGEVVLLLSSAFCKWAGIKAGQRVKFGGHKNAYYSLIDFSNGRMVDGSKPYVFGNVKNMLTSHRIEPSRISVVISFNDSRSREKCLGIIPYKDTDNFTSMSKKNENYHFSKWVDVNEPVTLSITEDLYQVKIRILDQDEHTLRLINNLQFPTVAALTFK